MLSFVGDAVVALLLVATIGYSMILNRRLTSVRADREKFETLVRNLTTASTRAEAAVTGLRVASDELGRRLEKKVEEGRSLSDDLTYMIERGGNMADKLASQIRASREELKPDFRPEPVPAPRPQARPEHVVERVARPAAQRQAPQYRQEPQIQMHYEPEPDYVDEPVYDEPEYQEPRYQQPKAASAQSQAQAQVMERPQPRRAEFPMARSAPVNAMPPQASAEVAAVMQAALAEARREAPRVEQRAEQRAEPRAEPRIEQRAEQRADAARVATRPAFVRSETRAEPRIAVPAAAMESDVALAERANPPSRAERDLLRALAARRR